MTERRRRRLAPEERLAIDSEDAFWRLADAGYLSYRRVGSDSYELVGHKYVGRALLGKLDVQVHEKVSGTLLALIEGATGAELRVETADSPATEFDLISRHLLTEFTRAAGRYIADRRKPRYSYARAVGPVLAGSLNIPATMRLHATGRLGQFAYDRGTVVRDEPLDRLVLAGLDELDRAAEALHLGEETLYDARWLSGALEDVRDERFVTSSIAELLALGDRIERDPASELVDVDLARLAVVALLHRGFEPALASEEKVPRAWFLDLETLFEQAVRETLRCISPGDEVDRGEAFPRRMFMGGGDSSRTNPDLVLHRHGTVRAVGDVKYKSLAAGSGDTTDDEAPAAHRKKEGRPDLYQVLVHATSLDTDKAFLIYAIEGAPVYRYLGQAPNGCHTWTAQVRPTHLAADLTGFLEASGLL